MTRTRKVIIVRKEVPKIKNKRAFDLAGFIKISAEVKKIIEKEKNERGADFGGGRLSSWE